ncbi:MAG: DHHA1 domain-containing protein [Alphaproteobacteria bacterium]
MRSLLDDMKKKNGSGVYVLGGVEDDKVCLIIGISDDLTSRFDAVDFVKASVDFIGGKGGGGRKDMAQAGGNNAAGLPKVFSTIEELISKAS